MTLQTLWRRRVFELEILVVLGVLVADQLFYGAPVGWTTGAYLAVVALVLARRYRMDRLSRAHRRALFVTAAALAFALLVEPGPLASSLAAVGLVSIAMVGRSGPTASPSAWIDRWRCFLRDCWRVPARHARTRWAQRRPPRIARVPARADRRNAASRLADREAAVRAWALPLTGTLVFVGLFSIANPMFVHAVEQALRSIGDLLESGLRLLSPVRWLLWIATGAGLWVLLRVPIRSRDLARQVDLLPDVDRVERWIDGPVLVRSLVLFNAVFACQNLLDVRYLWGGATLPEAMTYAQYAHRGAYPLVATALMAAGLVLLVFRPGRAPIAARRSRPLVLLWIGQNVFLTFAAAWRLGLYVEAYGLTRLRVWAGLWMGLVAFGLATIVVRIVANRTQTWLVQLNAVAGALVLYGCSLANIDGAIAHVNTRHARAIRGHGVSLDVPYLASLGPEVAPALEWYVAHATAPTDRVTQAAGEAVRLRQELETDLADWRGWTLRRSRIAASAPATRPARVATGAPAP